MVDETMNNLKETAGTTIVRDRGKLPNMVPRSGERRGLNRRLVVLAVALSALLGRVIPANAERDVINNEDPPAGDPHIAPPNTEIDSLLEHRSPEKQIESNEIQGYTPVSITAESGGIFEVLSYSATQPGTEPFELPVTNPFGEYGIDENSELGREIQSLLQVMGRFIEGREDISEDNFSLRLFVTPNADRTGFRVLAALHCTESFTVPDGPVVGTGSLITTVTGQNGEQIVSYLFANENERATFIQVTDETIATLRTTYPSLEDFEFPPVGNFILLSFNTDGSNVHIKTIIAKGIPIALLPAVTITPNTTINLRSEPRFGDNEIGSVGTEETPVPTQTPTDEPEGWTENVEPSTYMGLPTMKTISGGENDPESHWIRVSVNGQVGWINLGVVSLNVTELVLPGLNPGDSPVVLETLVDIEAMSSMSLLNVLENPTSTFDQIEQVLARSNISYSSTENGYVLRIDGHDFVVPFNNELTGLRPGIAPNPERILGQDGLVVVGWFMGIRTRPYVNGDIRGTLRFLDMLVPTGDGTGWVLLSLPMQEGSAVVIHGGGSHADMQGRPFESLQTDMPPGTLFGLGLSNEYPEIFSLDSLTQGLADHFDCGVNCAALASALYSAGGDDQTTMDFLVGNSNAPNSRKTLIVSASTMLVPTEIVDDFRNDLWYGDTE